MLKIGTFDPARTWGDRHTVAKEMVEMTSQHVLAGVVREWANQELPGEPGAADRAAMLAAASYADGASIFEACAGALAFIESWIRHPANGKCRHENLELVS